MKRFVSAIPSSRFMVVPISGASSIVGPLSSQQRAYFIFRPSSLLSAPTAASPVNMLKRFKVAQPVGGHQQPLVMTSRSMFSTTSSALCAAATADTNASSSIPRPREYLRPSPTNQTVAAWLYFCAAMVGLIIVVGGITRLTESGLSIVDWRPVTGAIPPRTQAEWETEFAKYKNFPEYKQKPDMTLSEFKQIFFWEWFHRFLARSVGLAYALPLAYFVVRGRLSKSATGKRSLVGFVLLFAAQGGMGWYMVKSGLKRELLDERKKATVSAYRLAIHLTLALILFTGFIRTGVGLRHFAINFQGHQALQNTARAVFCLTFVTAFSGAFVAGLDAGFLYNDGFPLMGGRVFPPLEELFEKDLPLYRNFFENPVMAQTFHRVMAGITSTATIGLAVVARRTPGPLPPQVKRALMMVYGAVALQATLGMLTIITRMHLHMAATHQSGAVFLLAMVCRLCAILGSRGIVL
eukprot:GILI01039594.1.p1 GENE.GILI01039594.1~~GILI01039594.1.p1  ORF type:complete len:466 (+),score=70.85 GILI01039594.1:67-1464(+)